MVAEKPKREGIGRMKRWGILAALLLLAGCTAQPQQVDYEERVRQTLGGNYSFTAAVTYEEIDAEATVEKQAEDHFVISVTSPDSMAGLVLTLAAEDTVLTYHGMEVDLTGYQLPAESVASILRKVLGGADEYTFQEQENEVTATGGDVLFHYVIRFEKTTMTPQSIEVPELGLTVGITDFKTLEAV